MYSAIIFLSLLILLLSVMLVIELQVFFDFNSNTVKIVIRVFKLKIFRIDINILTFNYRINNSKKIKQLKIVLDKKEKYFIEQIKSNLLSKLYYDRFELYSVVNIHSPSTTANIIGGINVFCELFEQLYLAKDNDIEVYYYNQADYRNNTNIVNLRLKVLFTIFDMVFAVVLSLYRRGKYAKQK